MTKTNPEINFSERVIAAVKTIPRGETMTYKNVAILAGRPGAYRAVGNILHKNYNALVPCHRVIKSNGQAGGYNRGVKNKIKKLRAEGVVWHAWKTRIRVRNIEITLEMSHI